MKSVLVFNSPKYRMGATESVLLSILKAREESYSLELLMESSWPLTIHNFATELRIPIYFTGKVALSCLSVVVSTKVFAQYKSTNKR